MPTISEIVHRVVHRDEHAYSSHPHVVRLAAGELVAVFNQSIRRSVPMHPPSDPLFRNLVVRSGDDGTTWSVPRVAPGYEWNGVECAGLTALRDGALLLNQWRFRWYPLETGLARSGIEPITPPERLPAYRPEHGELLPWARGNDGAYVHRSDDGGRTWAATTLIETDPYPGGYGMRGAVELSDGQLLLPLSDVPNWKRIFLVRSDDHGRSWGPAQPVADVPDKWFEEPALYALDDRHLVMLMREFTSDSLFSVTSHDGGASWTEPRPTGVLGCPPHLLGLPGGRLLCTYGYRYAPFEIRAVVSEDSGETWDVGSHLVIRTGLADDDIGYPATVSLGAGRYLTLYYAPDDDGVMAIQSSAFGLEP